MTNLWAILILVDLAVIVWWLARIVDGLEALKDVCP